MIFIGIIIGILIGFGLGWIIFKHKPQTEIRKINEEVIRQEQEKLNSVKAEITSAEQQLSTLRGQEDTLHNTINTLTEQSVNLSNQVIESRQKAEEIARKEFENSKEQLNEKLIQLEQLYADKEQEYIEQYLQVIRDYADSANEQMEALDQDKQLAEAHLQDLQAKVACGIELAKRQEEEKDKVNFYRLQLSEIDLEEIKRLREVEPYLRNKEALNKVIWKVYYEKPYQALIGRVIGNKIISGIYKITDLTSSKCYVGQSNSIAERWKQHIKRGLGAEAPTRNKLYPAMQAIGVENFSFEVIEECSKEKLNEEEKYWIDYFHSKEYGYNVTSGGA